MNLIFLGVILMKDILKTDLVYAAPKSVSEGHIGHTTKHTTHKNKYTTTEHEGTTGMEPIEYELRRDKIIPDLTTLDKTPEHTLKVVYEGDVPICFGNIPRSEAVQNVPESVSWYTEDLNVTFHTIVFVDLDVPSKDNPVEREWQHWIIGNVPDNNLKEGQTLTEYLGPTPDHGNGTHRYVFQLFLQKPGKIHFDEMHLPVRTKDFKRAQFSSKKFAKKYKLGRPYAVNYFLITWPEEPESEEEEDGTPMPPPPMPTGDDDYD